MRTQRRESRDLRRHSDTRGLSSVGADGVAEVVVEDDVGQRRAPRWVDGRVEVFVERNLAAGDEEAEHGRAALQPEHECVHVGVWVRLHCAAGDEPGAEDGVAVAGGRVSEACEEG